MVKKTQKKSTKQEILNTKINTLNFVIKLLILSIPIVFIVNLEWYGLQKMITIIISFLLNTVGVNNTLFDTMSSSLTLSPAIYLENGLVLIIDFACTGIRSFYLLFAIIFSLKWKPKKQLKFLLIGGLTLFIVNILRIFLVTLLVIQYNLPQLFENFLWTSMLNITVFIIIIFYLKT